MPNVTILDVVQRLLSDMDSDAVNSITETIEATQIAHVVRDTYENIVDEHRMHGTRRLFQLDGVSDTSRPNYLRIPAGYFNIDWVNYDARLEKDTTPQLSRVDYLPPQEFITRVNMRSADDPAVITVFDFHGGRLHIMDNKTPSFYTTFDNDYLVFDSYNKDVEDTLMESKTQAYGQFRPDLSLADSTVLDLPKHLLSLLVNEAREMVFEQFKDGAPQKITRNALRARVRAQRTDHKLALRNPADNLPDYGRRPRR
jgi:hypothetical protein